MKYRYIIIFFLGVLSASAQSKKIKIIDSLSLDPVSFATVFFSNNNGVISNELGFFELVPEQYKIQDTLFVSSMGYETKRIPITTFNDTIIRLKPETITLKNVVVTNKELSSIEIIEKVKQNIELNYNSGINENKLFFRQDYNQINEEFTLNKFKSSIKDLNAKVMDSILENLPKESRSELESLSYYYANDELDTPKIKLIKSRRTNDDNASDLSKSLGKKLESSLKENLKSSSYFSLLHL